MKYDDYDWHINDSFPPDLPEEDIHLNPRKKLALKEKIRYLHKN
jgi:hypothetical protein